MDAIVPQTNSEAQKSYQDQVVPELVAYEERKASAVGSVPRHSSLQVAVGCSCSSIILIRHGDYFRNSLSDTLQGLRPEGEVQAHRAGKFLKDNVIPTKFYHSNMTRSVETAKIIMGYFPPTPTICSHLLREVAFNDIGVKPHFKHLRHQSRGEDAYQDFINILYTGGSTAVFIIHANLIMYFLHRMLDDSIDKLRSTSNYSYCGISRVDVDSTGRFRGVYYNIA